MARIFILIFHETAKIKVNLKNNLINLLKVKYYFLLEL